MLRISTALLLGSILSALTAFAGSFQVSPVRIELSPAAPTAPITVKNESATDAVVVQLRAVNWKQESGEDVYTASTELIATPPIFTLQPGGSQTVRVGLRKAVATDVQQTFRIFITEVPGPPKPGFQGLQVALNIGIPVFIAPKTKNLVTPAWKASLAADGKVILRGTNTGNTHVQILELSLQDEAKATIATAQQPKYILAGQTVNWSLSPTQPPKGKVRVVARTDSGDVDTEVPLEAAPAGK